MASWSILELWKEYEDIAMHFNDLLIKLRTQALGGVAAISAFVTLFSKTDENTISWEIAAFIFLALIGFWTAIWVIDHMYYNRLLQGAVAAILILEEASKKDTHIDKIELSLLVKGAVDHPSSNSWTKAGGGLFYLIVLLVLIAGFSWSACNYLNS